MTAFLLELHTVAKTAVDWDVSLVDNSDMSWVDSTLVDKKAELMVDCLVELLVDLKALLRAD